MPNQKTRDDRRGCAKLPVYCSESIQAISVCLFKIQTIQRRHRKADLDNFATRKDHHIAIGLFAAVTEQVKYLYGQKPGDALVDDQRIGMVFAT